MREQFHLNFIKHSGITDDCSMKGSHDAYAAPRLNISTTTWAGNRLQGNKLSPWAPPWNVLEKVSDLKHACIIIISLFCRGRIKHVSCLFDYCLWQFHLPLIPLGKITTVRDESIFFDFEVTQPSWSCDVFRRFIKVFWWVQKTTE